MIPVRYTVDQNTDEWMALRLGKFTASSFADLFMGEKTKGLRDAKIKVAFERVTGQSEEFYSNKWMKRGHEREPEARSYYEDITGNEVEDAGFYAYGSYIGASPDGKIVGENAGIEIKCPSFSVYAEYLESNEVPKAYYWQVHGQLLCTGWDYIDFIAYNSKMLPHILIRVNRDEDVLVKLKKRLYECIREVRNFEYQLKKY